MLLLLSFVLIIIVIIIMIIIKGIHYGCRYCFFLNGCPPDPWMVFPHLKGSYNGADRFNKPTMEVLHGVITHGMCYQYRLDHCLNTSTVPIVGCTKYIYIYVCMYIWCLNTYTYTCMDGCIYLKFIYTNKCMPTSLNFEKFPERNDSIRFDEYLSTWWVKCH